MAVTAAPGTSSSNTVPPIRRPRPGPRRPFGAVLALSLALATSIGGLAACSDDGDDGPSLALQDPCTLITDDVLARLAPDGERVPTRSMGDHSGSLECAVDLTSTPSDQRGDLGVDVTADGSRFDDAWQAERCQDIDAEVTSSGPGDTSCTSVRPFDGSQARFDGYAWSERGYQVHVQYQLVEPQVLPATAEADVRVVLAAGVAALPSD
ncbi:hypothetical protein BH10ACT1_BH10ACT1_16590 [soil metagenome]